jgi:hypothetical protein
MAQMAARKIYGSNFLLLDYYGSVSACFAQRVYARACFARRVWRRHRELDAPAVRVTYYNTGNVKRKSTTKVGLNSIVRWVHFFVVPVRTSFSFSRASRGARPGKFATTGKGTGQTSAARRLAGVGRLGVLVARLVAVDRGVVARYGGPQGSAARAHVSHRVIHCPHLSRIGTRCHVSVPKLSQPVRSCQRHSRDRGIRRYGGLSQWKKKAFPVPQAYDS